MQDSSLPRQHRVLELRKIFERCSLHEISDDDRRALASAACCQSGRELPAFEEYGCSTAEFFGWIQDGPCALDRQLCMLEAVVDQMVAFNKLEPIALRYACVTSRSYDDAVAEQQTQLERPAAKLRIVAPDKYSK